MQTPGTVHKDLAPPSGTMGAGFPTVRCLLLGLAVTLVGPREPCPRLGWKSQFYTVHSTGPPSTARLWSPHEGQPLGAIMAKCSLGH